MGRTPTIEAMESSVTASDAEMFLQLLDVWWERTEKIRAAVKAQSAPRRIPLYDLVGVNGTMTERPTDRPMLARPLHEEIQNDASRPTTETLKLSASLAEIGEGLSLWATKIGLPNGGLDTFLVELLLRCRSHYQQVHSEVSFVQESLLQREQSDTGLPQLEVIPPDHLKCGKKLVKIQPIPLKLIYALVLQPARQEEEAAIIEAVWFDYYPVEDEKLERKESALAQAIKRANKGLAEVGASERIHRKDTYLMLVSENIQ